MGYEGDTLVSNLPALDEVPLSALAGSEDPAKAQDEPCVPVAEFQSSV